jgi:PAS domain S-box-containing protein
MLPHSDSLTILELKSAIIRDPLLVGLDTTVAEAIAQMSGIRTTCIAAKTASGQLEELYLEARSSCVLVVDSDRVVGILTERDVVSLIAQNYDLEHLSMQSVMIHPVITLRESAFTDLFFAENLLQTYHIRHIPILDDRERVVGMVTHESLRRLSRPTDLLRLRLVSEVMTTEVVYAAPDSSILAVALLMANHRVSTVMIVEAQPLQIPVGIVTERDIVQFQAVGLNLETCIAQTVMSTPIFAVTPNDSLWLVQQMMEQRFIRRLAVTGEEGELLGIVTQSSLLQALNPLELFNLAEILEAKVAKLESEKLNLLESRTIELEQQVEVRTIALKTKAEQEKLVADIASQIRSSLSLETILDSAVTAVRKLLGCDRAYICQFINNTNFDTNSESLIVVAESTDSLDSLMGMDITDQCFEGDIREIYRQGQIRIVPDIYTTPMHECHREMLIRLHTRSKILVPLIYEDRLWGLLNVCESQQPRDWQPEEVELLRMLSVQLAIAIQQATIHQKLQAQVIELQKSETRLRESEQQYVSLTTAAPVGIFRTDASGKCTYVNDRWCYVAGLTPETAMGSGWIRAIHADDRNKVSLEWERSARDNNLFRLEYRFQRPDGTLTWVYGQSVAELDAEGQIIGYVGTITDISDRKLAERALEQLNQNLETEVAQRTADLQASETTNRTTLDAIPDLLLRLKRDGSYISYIKSELKGENFLPITNHIADVLPPELLQTQLQMIERAIATRELQVYEHQFYKQDRLVYEEVRILAIDDQEVLAIIRDISDRKRAEEMIHQQAKEEKVLREITQRIRQSLDLHTIFDTACEEVRQLIQADRVGIFKLDPKSNFDDGVFVAESFVEGLSSVLEIKVHDHCFGEKYAPLYQQGRYAAMDDIYQLERCHTHVLVEFQVRSNLVIPLLCGNQLWGLLCIHQCFSSRHWQQHEIDLTQQIANQLAIAIQQASLFEQLQQELVERHQAEVKLTESNQSLAISNQELARATRLKDEFLANMSHELRTPLNAIMGMTEGLQEQVFGSINNRQLKALQTVERSSTHLLELINDILDVAKIESGQIELDYAPTAIAPLCQSSLAFIKQQALKKRIQLEIRLQPHLPDLFVDERRIRQVLINLLNNALKFTPEGGKITLEVSHTAAESEELVESKFLRIAVMDTGIGISAENIKKLFQPFIQIDSALNRQYTGTGLGLALVKRIVELHGGNVELTSEVGIGSCFAIELPFTLDTSPILEITINPAPSSEQESQPQKTSLILLAEDNEANVSTFSSYLNAKGYRLIVAKDGEEAIALAKAHTPDIILMDIQMPIMDGLEATKQIRLDPNLGNIPIIALTALAMSGDRERCLEAGANDYLAKPIKLKELNTTIQRILTDT